MIDLVNLDISDFKGHIVLRLAATVASEDAVAETVSLHPELLSFLVDTALPLPEGAVTGEGVDAKCGSQDFGVHDLRRSILLLVDNEVVQGEHARVFIVDHRGH